MATAPAFVAAGRVVAVNVATANTAYDGTGSITTLISGAATGTRILEIDVKCAATSAVGVVNIFLSADSGTTWKLIDSIAVTAVTASATVMPFEIAVSYSNLILPDTNHRLGVTTTISQSTNVIALGGDF